MHTEGMGIYPKTGYRGTCLQKPFCLFFTKASWTSWLVVVCERSERLGGDPLTNGPLFGASVGD